MLLAELDPKRTQKGLPPIDRRNKAMRGFLEDAYDLVVTLLDTGARYGELAKIEWKQIDLDRCEIHLWRPKVKNESVLFMTNRVHDILARRKIGASTQYVFTNKAGEPQGSCGAID